MPVPGPFDTALDLYDHVHLFLCSSDGVGPPPCWNLTLVEFVDLSRGTTTQKSGHPCLLLVFLWILERRYAYLLVSGRRIHMRIQMGTEKAPYTKPDLTPRARSMGGVA
jgi:hypothetical protein